MQSVLKTLLLVVLVISAFGGGAPVAAQQAREEGGAKNDLLAEWEVLFLAIEEKKTEIDRSVYRRIRKNSDSMIIAGRVTGLSGEVCVIRLAHVRVTENE